MNKVKWDSGNIQDQTGKTVIVTGASSGLGFEASRVLAAKNAEVILAVRDTYKGEKASAKIIAEHKNANVKVMKLDLADLKSITSFAENFTNEYSSLNILINNAGVMIPPYSKTKDGFELQFGTNHLGHYALTGLLFDLLKNSNNPRIVNVSSSAHKYGNLNFKDLNWEKRKYKAWKAYGDSKISNLYFTYEITRRLANIKSKLIVAASHPGWAATELQRHSNIFEVLNPLLAQKPEMGALPILYAATAENVKSGDYFGPSGWMEWRGYPIQVSSNELSNDETIARKLWEISEDLTGVKIKL